MNRFGLVQRVQIASSIGITGLPSTDRLPTTQGVTRTVLTLTGPTLHFRSTADSISSMGVGNRALQFRVRRQVGPSYFHRENRSLNLSCKAYILLTNQDRKRISSASLASTAFYLKPSRPSTNFRSSFHIEGSNIDTYNGKRFYHSHSEGPGWEVYPSTFNSPEKTKKFLKKLRRKQRVLLMNELQVLNQELNKDGVLEEQTQLLPPSRTQLRLVLINNAVPFIGFGFLDNAIMIAAGDYIDWKIGAALHISTMAAAGLGNLVSDLAGVVLAGYVEAFAARLGIPSPNLSLEQYEMKQSKLASSIGRCLGIAVGCLLGMFPLLFLNTDREDDDDNDDGDGKKDEADEIEDGKAKEMVTRS